MIYHQSVFQNWPFEDNSIQAIITSPPYYSLRKYDIPDIIIGGSPKCGHTWVTRRKDNTGGTGELSKKQTTCAGGGGGFTSVSGTCIHCNAWLGQYGLEPTYQLYIEHTLLWANEAWRVLKDDGLLFLNLGDSWNGSGGSHKPHHRNNKGFQGEYSTKCMAPPNMQKNVPSKCKLLIPHRIAIGLIDNGWILRNDIVWYKPNAMPESARDRFSKKFEYIFMFSKKEKYYFDLDAVREESIWAKTDKRSQIRGGKLSGGKTASGQYGINRVAYHPNGKNPGDMWAITTQPSPEKHYAMWPEQLVARMILCSTKPDDIVLDPFCGSGTTLYVALKYGRQAYGMDLGYDDIQTRRLEAIQMPLGLGGNR